MWTKALEKEYIECVYDLIQNPLIQKMDNIEQHVDDMSCLDHSIYVSAISFALCKKWKLNARAVARAGLLHDLYLLNWDEDTDFSQWERLTKHPQIALDNAKKHFNLTKLEQDIISKHMWPLTITKMPKYKESMIVNIVDTACAIAEFTHTYKTKKVLGLLTRLNRRRFLTHNQTLQTN